MVKGFKKKGKFIPTGNKQKSKRSKVDVVELSSLHTNTIKHFYPEIMYDVEFDLTVDPPDVNLIGEVNKKVVDKVIFNEGKGILLTETRVKNG